MFVEDSKLEYGEFVKCLNSYHSFVELWWEIRASLLKRVQEAEPDWERKLTVYSELGIIRREMLWKKALSKVDADSRIKI